MASSLVPLTAVGARAMRKDLESLVGRLMRFSSIPPFHKLFLFEFYRLLRKPRCVNKKVPHAVFGELLVPMSDDLVLTRGFPAADLLVGWRLFQCGRFRSFLQGRPALAEVPPGRIAGRAGERLQR